MPRLTNTHIHVVRTHMCCSSVFLLTVARHHYACHSLVRTPMDGIFRPPHPSQSGYGGPVDMYAIMGCLECIAFVPAVLFSLMWLTRPTTYTCSLHHKEMTWLTSYTHRIHKLTLNCLMNTSYCRCPSSTHPNAHTHKLIYPCITAGTQRITIFINMLITILAAF